MFLVGVDCRLCDFPFHSSSHLSVMSSDLVCYSQRVTCVVAMSDGRRVISGSNDETLRVWDVDTGECVRELKGHREVSEC
jgi:WD40 repeat protein